MTAVLQSNTIRRELESIDWDFNESSRRLKIHDIHPYPARFIPQIPRELIRKFHPHDSSVVFDPFCGSGTTLVEAAAQGLPSIGIDLNPLAVLISEVKTTPVSHRIGPIASEIAAKGREANMPIPAIPRLEHWFRKEIQQALANITALIKAVEDLPTHKALSVAISRIIVRVSNQESDTRYAAINKSVSQHDVYDLFVKSADLIDSALEEVYGSLFPMTPSCKLIAKDVLTATPREIGSVGLVITSPPYPNAYEYWLYHKYRMYWLGMDPIEVRSAEIGARPHYFKKNPQTEKDFELQMGKCFGLLDTIVIPRGIVCFVIGRSIINGREIDNAALVERAAAENSFGKVGSVTRQIPSNRKSFNPAHSSITEEQLLIFQRDI